MNKIKSSLILSTSALKRVISKSDNILLVVCLFVALNYVLVPLSAFSKEVGQKLTLWFIPYMFSDVYVAFILQLGVIFIFSNMPNIDSISPYEIIRAGRNIWFVSRVLYVMIASATYVLLIIIVSGIVTMPSLTICKDWGAVLSTLAQVDVGNSYDGLIVVTMPIQILYTPIEATLLSLNQFWLISIYLGFLIQFINIKFGKQNKYLGSLLALAMTFGIFFAYNMRNKYLYHITPTIWGDLNILDISGTSAIYPSLIYSNIALVLISTVLVLLTYYETNKMDIVHYSKN